MTEPRKREVDDVYARFLKMLREQNEAGEISGLAAVVLHVAENHVHAGRSGYIPRDRRVEDVAHLIHEVKRNPNFNKTLSRGTHRRPVAEQAKSWTRRLIGELDRHVEQGLIEGICAVVYGADGSTNAFSRSDVPLSSMLLALGYLTDVAWGEDGLVGRSCCLDLDRFLFTPSPEADRYARAMGENLSAPICSCCGEPMRLIRLSPCSTGLPEPRMFACKPCKIAETVSAGANS